MSRTIKAPKPFCFEKIVRPAVHHLAAVAFCAATAFGTSMANAQSSDAQVVYRQIEELRKSAQTEAEMKQVLDSYLPLALSGHARSAFRIGDALYRGTLTEAQPVAGITYYRRAAELGFDPAWRYLAFALLKDGQGEAALDAFNKALEVGLTGFEMDIAMNHIGQGFGAKSDFEAGLAMLQSLTDAGNTEAAVALARVYADPENTIKDFRAARALLEPLLDSEEADNEEVYRIAEIARKSAVTREQMIPVIATYEELAASGHSRSAFRLGNIYGRGILTDRDTELGIDYLRMAGDLGFDPAWRYLGAELLRAGRGGEALTAFDKALQAGETGFEVILAKAHFDRRFGTASDPRIGVKLLENRVLHGDIEAQSELAKILANPESGIADFRRAYELAAPLADSGNVDAMMLVAGLYQSGAGVERSYPLANDLYLRAAAAGENSAVVRAAEVEIRRGLTTRATERLMDAVSQGIPGAGAVLADAHIRGLLADKSERHTGILMTETGVAAGDLSFVILALDLIVDDVWIQVDTETLINQAERAAEDGNSFAAEALLRALRGRPQAFDAPLKKRGQYLERFAGILRPHAFAQEKAALMLETMPRNMVLAELRKLLAGSDFETYYSTLVGVSRSDRNAYVYLVQHELSQAGVYKGQPNGLLNSGTLRSILAFCAENGYAQECEHGPLRGTAVRLFSASLAMRNS